ncbi:unnamed protein product, partial [Protopolystoma xenopodis]
VVLVFERHFWDRSQRLFGHISQSPETRGELFLFWSVTDRPILIALVAGRAARQLEQYDAAQIGPTSGSTGSLSLNRRTSSVNIGSVSVTPGQQDSIGTVFGQQALKNPIVSRAMMILRSVFMKEANDLAGKSIPESKLIFSFNDRNNKIGLVSSFCSLELQQIAIFGLGASSCVWLLKILLPLNVLDEWLWIFPNLHYSSDSHYFSIKP